MNNIKINQDAIKKYLNTKIIGKKIIVLDEVDSTNTYLKDLISENIDNGTVVITTNQTSGKGRLNRKWLSEKGKTICMSILLKTSKTNFSDCAISPLTGLAVSKAINKLCLTDCKIKWPNDVVINNKKLCGILSEVLFQGDDVYIILGIGINVDSSVFPDEISFKATSIFRETGRFVEKNTLISEILNQCEKYILGYQMHLTGEAIIEYRNNCISIGREVIFNRGNRDISGMAVAVNNNGELEVMLSDGTIVTVNCGDVIVQGIY